MLGSEPVILKVVPWTNSARGSRTATYGLQVSRCDRKAHFKREWDAILVELDGKEHRFVLTASFWGKCPEFRDRGAPIIRNWLRERRALEWPTGQKPEFNLVKLGAKRFRLEG